LSSLAVRSGNNQTALAGTVLPSPIVIVPQDASGNTVPDQAATFVVIAGGGSLSSSSGQTNSDGTITAPTWTLGKSDVPQEMRVDVNGTTTIVGASVRTSYVLDVRFYGKAISSTHQALFTSAAARVRGFVVGSAPPINMNGAEMEFCTGAGSAPLSEVVNGLLTFASVDTIDGPGTTLAHASACYFRGQNDFRTIVGVMKFDDDDIDMLGSSLQTVILHEMLHLVGLGTYWGPEEANLLTGAGGPGASYTGAAGIAGCQAIGGSVTCANSVPVEDCVGLNPGTKCGPGQQDVHWKETTFTNELMTTYFNSAGNLLSIMTIRSFEDLGYTVNTAAADQFSIAAFSALSTAEGASPALALWPQWEGRSTVRPRPVAVWRGNQRN
jgi:hypothetical protein